MSQGTLLTHTRLLWLLLQIILLSKNVSTLGSDPAKWPIECVDNNRWFYLDKLRRFQDYGLGNEVPRSVNTTTNIKNSLCDKYTKNVACDHEKYNQVMYMNHRYVLTCHRKPVPKLSDAVRRTYAYDLGLLDETVLCHRDYCPEGRKISTVEDKLKYSIVVKGNCFAYTNIANCYYRYYWTIVRLDVRVSDCVPHDDVLLCVRNVAERGGCNYHFLVMGLKAVSAVINNVTKMSPAKCTPTYIEHFYTNRRTKERIESNASRIRSWTLTIFEIILLLLVTDE